MLVIFYGIYFGFCVDVDVSFVEVCGILMYFFVEVRFFYGFVGFFDYFVGICESEAENIVVNLLLDCIEIKIFFFDYFVVCVGVYKNC